MYNFAGQLIHSKKARRQGTILAVPSQWEEEAKRTTAIVTNTND